MRHLCAAVTQVMREGVPISADRRHEHLLRRLAVALAVIDAMSATQCWFGGPVSIHLLLAVTLSSGALVCVAAYALARLGRARLSIALLVATEAAIPAVITLVIGEHDLYALFNLGGWLTASVLVAASFVEARGILAVGGAALAIFFVTLVAAGGRSFQDAANPMTFMITTTCLTAVVAAHRSRLERIRRAELVSRNEELDRLRRTLEEQVTERTAALLATEKMAVVGRLTAGIAHELASPLGAILATTEHIEELAEEYRASIGDAAVNEDDHRAIAAEMIEVAAVTMRAAERSANFVRSIKSQTRVGQPGKLETFDVVAVVEESVALLAHAARAGKCDVKISAEERPITLVGAPNRLSQVIVNLVQNAIDAAGERGGGTIDVTLSASDAGVRIAVCDDAGGIPDDVLPKIFEPLFTTKPFGRGTGLGLSIVKEAVERDLDGAIRVETTPGVGSTFVVELRGTKESKNAA